MVLGIKDFSVHRVSDEAQELIEAIFQYLEENFMKKIAFIIASTAILSACGGGEPSDTEIADALKKQVAEQIANSNGMLEEEDDRS